MIPIEGVRGADHVDLVADELLLHPVAVVVRQVRVVGRGPTPSLRSRSAIFRPLLPEK